MKSIQDPRLHVLLGLCDIATIQRGIDIARTQPSLLSAINTSQTHIASARIKGSHFTSYTVKVKNQTMLRGRCNCPVGEQLLFCKHQVALWVQWQLPDLCDAASKLPPTAEKTETQSLLAQAAMLRSQAQALDGIASQPLATPAQSIPTKPVKRVNRAMESLTEKINQTPPELIKQWLLTLCEQDKPTAKRLGLLISEADPNIDTSKKTITGLIGRAKFLDYRQSRAYADKISPIIGLVQRPITDRRYDAALQLAEFSVSRLQVIVSSIDDSDGEVQHVHYTLKKLFSYALLENLNINNAHALAKQWVKLFISLDHTVGLDEFLHTTYAEQYSHLHETAAYQVFLNSITQQLSAINSTEMQYHLVALLQLIAQHLGHVDDWLALEQSKDRPDALSIIAVLKNAQRTRQAVQVAEQAIKKASHSDDRSLPHLRSILANLYLDDGLTEDGLALLWENYYKLPLVEHYSALINAVANHLPNESASWKNKAFHHIKRLCESQPLRGGANPIVDYSAYFKVLLNDSNDDHYQQAFDLIAADQLCETPQLEHILLWRLNHSPLDGFQRLSNMCRQFLSGKLTFGTVGNSEYYKVLHILDDCSDVMQTPDLAHMYHTFINQLRIEFKAKRNLIPLLAIAQQLVPQPATQ